MIVGIGTDIVAIQRMADLWQKHGKRAMKKVLAPSEREDCLVSPHPERLLAKRFAAKEALGKALGTGIRAPVLLPDIAVTHDDSGKPSFIFSAELDKYLAQKNITAHLSLSDEQDYAVAFVVLETR